MSLSTYFNNIIGSKFAGIFRTGKYGNTSNATLLTLNNLIEQINLTNNYTKVYYKYKSGVTSMGVTYQVLEAVNIINGFVPGSNPANKQNNPCDTCTPCQAGIWNWTGKPCWKIAGTNGAACTECKATIEDMSDGVYNGTAGKAIKLPNINPIFDPNDPFGPSSIYFEAIHVPKGYIVNFEIDNTTNPLVNNTGWFFMINAATGLPDYAKINQVVFVQTFFNNVQGFVSPQGPH